MAITSRPIIKVTSTWLLRSDEAGLAKADCIVIVTDHTCFDYKGMVEKASLIVDTRNALKGVISDKLVRL